jgi:hypothetical protein
MTDRVISKSVIKRLPVYLRILDQLTERKVEIVSSKEFSNESGLLLNRSEKTWLILELLEPVAPGIIPLT